MNKLLVSASVALGATSLSFAQQTEKPNFLLFIADDCSHYDLGCYGSVDSKTPNIDHFATQGVRFTQAYQAVPMSSPTRHNLYTGLWPVRSGAYPNHTCANEGTLSVVHHLQPLGYKVALIGKSHICRAARCSAWPSPAPSSTTPTSCWPTSPPAHWTARRASRSWSC